MSDAALIAIDWGTTNARAMLLDEAGSMVATAESDEGIASVPTGGHAAAFARLTAGWLAAPGPR